MTLFMAKEQSLFLNHHIVVNTWKWEMQQSHISIVDMNTILSILSAPMWTIYYLKLNIHLTPVYSV